MPPGLVIVPLSVSVSFSLMLEDERTSPGEANLGAGSLIKMGVWAKAVKVPSESVTPMLYLEEASLVYWWGAENAYDPATSGMTVGLEPSPQSIEAVRPSAAFASLNVPLKITES